MHLVLLKEILHGKVGPGKEEILHWKVGPGKEGHIRVLTSCNKVILISHTICGKVYHNLDIAAYLTTYVYHRVGGGLH